MATVATLDNVGSRWKQFVVEKRQGLLQVGGLQFAYLADYFETADTATRLGEFRQRGVGAAATVKQTIDFLHDVTQRSQLRQTTRDLPERATFRKGQVVLDEKMAMLENVGDFLLQSFGETCGPFASTIRAQVSVLMLKTLFFFVPLFSRHIGSVSLRRYIGM